MFKRLRNRFLLLHMGMVSLLIALFFSAVLLVSYYVLERTTDIRADALWNRRITGGYVSIIEMPQGRALLDRSAPPDQLRMNMRVQSMPGIYVMTDGGKSIIELESAYDMEDSFYTAITQAAIAEGEAAGKLRIDGISLKYRRGGNAQRREYLFIDVTGETVFFSNMVYLFLLIALPLLVLLFFLSRFFANRYIRPIEASYNRQREFIADASHELKTPLTAISANLEAAGGGQDTGKWLGYIRSEVDRMAGLTNNLLYLAKSDGDRMVRTALPVNISGLFTDMWLPLEAVLFEKGIEAETHAAPGVVVQGDEEQLRRLLGILLDNALRYARKKITVTLAKQQNTAVFTVANDGPGITSDKLDKIWERFYRGDPSRLYDGGFGLGLPMAKAITERHRGKIICESVPEEVTVFTLRLPG